MSSLTLFLVAFACMFGGLLLGMVLNALLPDHHLSDDSKDMVKLAIGVIATLSALVLGLLIASAKGNFDTVTNELRYTSTKIILLDRLMAQYGPETRESRDLLHRGITSQSSVFGRKNRIRARSQWPINPVMIWRRSKTNFSNCPRRTKPSAGLSHEPCRSALKSLMRAGFSRADGSELSALALPCGANLLAYHHVWQFWPIFSPQWNGHLCSISLCLIRCCRTLSDPGVGPG
ncbi:MAG: hypothetical protein MZU95_12050 [Desulfomicrobium escambiense]|nr:hypothetical protein [Desulfomicrobium escambiense]